MAMGVEMNETRRNRNIVYRCWYHAVWCTKYRRPVLTSNHPGLETPPLSGDPGPVDERLKEIIGQLAEETGTIIQEIEVMPDHVHMIISVDPQYDVGKFIRLAKGRTSRHLRLEYPSLKRRLPTLWTNSYSVSIIKQYFANQRGI